MRTEWQLNSPEIFSAEGQLETEKEGNTEHGSPCDYCPLLAGGLRKQVLEYGLQEPHLALTANFLCGELRFIGLTKQGSTMEHTALNPAIEQPGKLC